MDWTTITTAIITAMIPATVTLIGVLISNKGTKDLMSWRIDKLETSVQKHNNLIERMAILEKDSETKWLRIDELREEMEKVKNEQN